MDGDGGQFRDLSLVKLDAHNTLVIACDCSAGIGEKRFDEVLIDPAITAAYSVRVPLMELMCFGADPVTVVDTIGNELQPTGERIIWGIQQELKRAGLAGIPLNGSTEDNMQTQTTSIGVTVVAKLMRPMSPRFTSLGRPSFTSSEPHTLVRKLKSICRQFFHMIWFERSGQMTLSWICCRWALAEFAMNWFRWPKPITPKLKRLQI
ncbi:AIR synthase related protein [Lentilactobacillus rapi]|uniref:AIR synthase related protein n=1 Tax=Lentilactobacillus rapi TaxID=481723 RepID=UPI000AED8622|nr:AIR synthase related protein [Lentilactobacillus rapi]